MSEEQDIQAQCDEFQDQLEITECALSRPEIYVEAMRYGLGPVEGQSLGEWIADTINDARRRAAKNSDFGVASSKLPRRSRETARSAQSASGEPQ